MTDATVLAATIDTDMIADAITGHLRAYVQTRVDDGFRELRQRLAAAVYVGDGDDVTDWQRGYRACSERALAVLGTGDAWLPRPLTMSTDVIVEVRGRLWAHWMPHTGPSLTGPSGPVVIPAALVTSIRPAP